MIYNLCETMMEYSICRVKVQGSVDFRETYTLSRKTKAMRTAGQHLDRKQCKLEQCVLIGRSICGRYCNNEFDWRMSYEQPLCDVRFGCGTEVLNNEGRRCLGEFGFSFGWSNLKLITC